MTNSNELTVRIRAKDEFSDIFASFGTLCKDMQSSAKSTAEVLDCATAALTGNLESLRQYYGEFAQLRAILGSGETALPDMSGSEQISGSGVDSQDADIGAFGGIFPFDNINTAATLTNIEAVKSAMLEFQEFKLAQQEFNTQLMETELQQSTESTQQLLNDMQTLQAGQSQSQGVRLQMLTGFLNNMGQAQKLFGKEYFGVAKALAVSEATVAAYLSFNKTMGAYPYPINAAMAGISLATSLVQVSKIMSTSAGIAHGGLDYVPKEQTYLLDHGERVLSPRQNRDLTNFLDDQNSGAVTIENIYIEILPNVTEAGALKDLDERTLRDFVEDRLLTALRELKLAGLSY